MTFQLPVERSPAHAQHSRGHSLLAAHLLKCTNDVVTLDVDKQRGLCLRQSITRLRSHLACPDMVRRAVLQRVDGRGETFVASRQDRLRARARVLKGPNDVETCHPGSLERQHRAVVVDYQKTGTLSLHIGLLQMGAHQCTPGSCQSNQGSKVPFGTVFVSVHVRKSLRGKVLYGAGSAGNPYRPGERLAPAAHAVCEYGTRAHKTVRIVTRRSPRFPRGDDRGRTRIDRSGTVRSSSCSSPGDTPQPGRTAGQR